MQACTRPLSHHHRGAIKMGFSPYLDRAGLRAKETILTQMADDLRIFAANLGSVTESELELMGWTPEQIATHGREASRRAYARAAKGER